MRRPHHLATHAVMPSVAPVPRAAPRAAGLALALFLLPAVARAQLPSASAAATGLGENYTARARGADAPAWNPAVLGLPGTPNFHLVLGGLRAGGTLDPIGLETIGRYSGRLLPDAERRRWLAQIRDAGRQRLDGDAGTTWVALALGRVAVQVATEVHATGDIPPDAAELVLFGNFGRDSATRDLAFGGARIAATAVTTTALSIAQPLRLRLGRAADQHFAIGITGKYIAGNALVLGRDFGGRAGTSPLELDVNFPVVQSDSAGDARSDAGRGFGLDVGASWQAGRWTVAAVVRNVVNTFEWKVDDFYWRRGAARYDADTSYADYDTVRAIAGAPAALVEEVRALKYDPVLALGTAWRVGGRTVLTADVRQRFGDGGMNADPKSHVGVGAELRPLRFLPLRVGMAQATDGFRLAGGVGLEFGYLNLNASAARRFGGDASGGALAVGLSFGGR